MDETMNDIYTGELVRLSAMTPEEASKAFARWGRDSEFRRLIDSGVSNLASQTAIQKWLEKELDESSVNQHWFSIRKLDDDTLLGDIDLYVSNWSGREAFVGLGIGEREFWGRGYGTDVMNVILRYAFTEVNLKRVTLTVFEYTRAPFVLMRRRASAMKAASARHCIKKVHAGTSYSWASCARNGWSGIPRGSYETAFVRRYARFLCHVRSAL